MNSLLTSLSETASKEFLASFTLYLESEGKIFDVDEFELLAHGEDLADILRKDPEESSESRLTLQFLLEGWGMNSSLPLEEAAFPMFNGRLEEGLDIIAKNPDKKFPSHTEIAGTLLSWGSNLDWALSEPATGPRVFQNRVSEFIWENALPKIIENASSNVAKAPLIEALTLRAPSEVKQLLQSLHSKGEVLCSGNWLTILETDHSFDSDFIRSLPLVLQAAQANSSGKATIHFAHNLSSFFKIERDPIQKSLLELILNPAFLSNWAALSILAQYREDIELINLIVNEVTSPLDEDGADQDFYKRLLDLAIDNLDTVGLPYLSLAISGSSFHSWGYRTSIVEQLLEQPKEHAPAIRKMLLEKVQKFSKEEELAFWKLAQGHSLFAPELEAMIGDSSATLREVAAQHLLSDDREHAFELGCSRLGGRTINDRLGGILLLQSFPEKAIPLFQAAFDREKSEKVRDLLQQLIGSTKQADKLEPANPVDLLSAIEKDKRLKLPKLPWLNPETLTLRDPDGKPFPNALLAFLIKWQLKHKAIEPCPEIIPLLPLLTHPKNHLFTRTLFSQFCDSDQAAKDRWVLTFAGLLGDDTIAPLLRAAVNRWAKAKRKELAACAAHALGLLGSDVALSMLDDIAQTFRQKGANIGRAASEAVFTAAKIRNLTVEELRDEITPTLEFDKDGILIMAEEDDCLHAQLQSDLTLTWLTPATGKTTKNPPAKTNPALKKRITAFKKLLKETATSQVNRLERALVTQRRWSCSKWHQLFDAHPILSRLSSRLVWASYSDGKISMTFRRYENGILSTVDGDMIDPEDLGDCLGIVHPCDLTGEDLPLWIEHFGRQKIVPLFPQLTRPIHLLDQSQANRRELRTIVDKWVAGTTFLSRAEKLGWLISGRIEGGMIPSIFKEFPTYDIDVNLEVDELNMGALAYSEAVTRTAHFVKHGSINRGEYACDLPKPDDPRVLSFGEVPPVVYSETISELNALIEGPQKS